MMSLHPQQRHVMQSLRDAMPLIHVTERRLRRTEALLIASAVVTFALLTLVGAFEEGAVEGVAMGLLFTVGALVGFGFANGRARRRSYTSLCELEEIAALNLAVLDDEHDDDA